MAGVDMGNRLPDELLLLIFLHLRNDSTTTTLTHSLEVCRKWHSAMLPLLYHDIYLTCSNLEKFVSFVPESRLPLVKSLTLKLHVSEPREGSSWKVSPSQANDTAEEIVKPVLGNLLASLQLLPNKITQMANLRTFSLVIAPQIPRMGFCMPPRVLATLLDALPRECTNLELELNGLERYWPVSEIDSSDSVHICDLIRQRLPKLKHLRLGILSICPALFGKAHVRNESADIADFPGYLMTKAPFLESLIISRVSRAVDPAVVYGPLQRTCQAEQEHTTNELPYSEITENLQAFASQTPAQSCICLFDSVLGSEWSWDTFFRRDIKKNTTLAIPFDDCGDDSIFSTVMRMPGQGGLPEDIISRFFVVRSVAEGQFWKETTNGFRLPASCLGDDGAIQYIPQPLETYSISQYLQYHSPYPWFEPFVWEKELKSGARLLDAEWRDGVFDDSPIPRIQA